MGNILKSISNFFSSQPGLVEEPDRIWYPYIDEENVTYASYENALRDYNQKVQEKDRQDLRIIRKYTIR